MSLDEVSKFVFVRSLYAYALSPPRHRLVFAVFFKTCGHVRAMSASPGRGKTKPPLHALVCPHQRTEHIYHFLYQAQQFEHHR